MELWEELEIKNKQLDQALLTLRKHGVALAEAERNYKEAVSKEVLRLRDEGVAVTLINQIIYGMPSISVLRFERDCASVLYNANQEAINIKKLQIRILESEIEREFGFAERRV